VQRDWPIRIATACAVMVAVAWSPAMAHHEAIFGPQSSLVLSAPAFATFQSFSKNTGAGVQETTFLLGGGVSPEGHPELSLALTVPASYQVGSSVSRFGMENVLVGARYRFEVKPLQRMFAKDGNFALGMVAIELPTGSIDYHTFEGPYNFLTAGLYSVEWRMFSMNAFIFYRHNGLDFMGSKKGDELFYGVGLGYTPIDRPGRLLSFQLGVSEEYHFADMIQRVTQPQNSGQELMLSPTIVFSPRLHWQFFALASFPASQTIGDATQQDRWRIGLGILYLLGGTD
jgi:hypothetical protein